MDKEFMHKNKLQDHAQRSAIPLPIYITVNEGSLHAPRFRSSVIVDGSEFTSNCTFSKKMVAEQDVAKCALEAIRSFIRNNSLSLIPNNLVIFKCILNEYAVKMNLKLPTYETCKGSGSILMFVSSVSFDNKTFKGEFGNSKKEAEQMGARAVIEFILGLNSDSGIVMTQIIKSKAKYATVSKLNGSSSSEIANAVMIRLMVRQTNVNQLEMQNTPNWDPSTSFHLCYPEPPAAARLTKKARVDEVLSPSLPCDCPDPSLPPPCCRLPHQLKPTPLCPSSTAIPMPHAAVSFSLSLLACNPPLLKALPSLSCRCHRTVKTPLPPSPPPISTRCRKPPPLLRRRPEPTPPVACR
ncbi:uncharacterized protein LOC141813993 [Curcuma longa]|uniref:uncharacterized protein LOC141813993 n=1 Tax=Curcuma longa TaxID=136217 RepID=UPI003D9DE411